VLTALRLENIALIDELKLRFEEGFTVLTGETGAGNIASARSPRHPPRWRQFNPAQPSDPRGGTAGPHRGSLSVSNEAVARWLEEQHLDSEDELALRRQSRLRANRLSSRSRLNRALVSRQQMMQLWPMLVDFTAQGQQSSDARSERLEAILDWTRLQGMTMNAAWSMWPPPGGTGAEPAKPLSS